MCCCIATEARGVDALPISHPVPHSLVPVLVRRSSRTLLSPLCQSSSVVWCWILSSAANGSWWRKAEEGTEGLSLLFTAKVARGVDRSGQGCHGSCRVCVYSFIFCKRCTQRVQGKLVLTLSLITAETLVHFPWRNHIPYASGIRVHLLGPSLLNLLGEPSVAQWSQYQFT